MSGGNPGQTTTVQSADPWSGAQPFLLDYMSRAKWRASQPTEYYPGNTVVPFSDASKMGMSSMMGMGTNPNSAARLGLGQFTDTLSGDYLPGGERFAAITDPTRNAVNAQFSSGSRYGSAGHEQAIAKGIMEAAQPYWDAERGRMMTASAAAPVAQMATISPMLQVGAMQEGKQGETIADRMARWNFAQNEPNERLQRYASLVSPGAGFGGTQYGTSTMPGGSKLAGAVGGGLTGAMMGSAMPLLGGGAAGTAGLAALGPAGIALGLLGAAYGGGYL